MEPKRTVKNFMGEVGRLTKDEAEQYRELESQVKVFMEDYYSYEQLPPEKKEVCHRLDNLYDSIMKRLGLNATMLEEDPAIYYDVNPYHEKVYAYRQR